MSEQVRINRDLVFAGIAKQTANVQGPMQETKRHDWDRFTGITLDIYRWSAASANQLAGTDDTIAISEVQGGSCLITTGTTDEDTTYMSGAVIYSGTKKAMCEFRIKISEVAQVAVFVGFTDEKYETLKSLALDYGTTGADTFRSPATDAAGFVIDADHSESSIMCCSTQAAGDDTTPVDTDVDWADDETKTLRVELDGTTANYWLDGVQVASIPNSCTAATLMCPTVQCKSQAAGGATTVYVLSYDGWQDN